MILTVCRIQWWLLCLCKPCWQSETSYCCVWKFYVHSCMIIIITSVLSMITLVLSIHGVQKKWEEGVEKNFFSRKVIVKNQLSVAIFNLCLFRSIFKLYKIIHSSLKLTWLLVKDFFFIVCLSLLLLAQDLFSFFITLVEWVMFCWSFNFIFDFTKTQIHIFHHCSFQLLILIFHFLFFLVHIYNVISY